MEISYKRGEEHWTTRTFGVALFVYSSYTDGKTREIVHAKFLYEEGPKIISGMNAVQRPNSSQGSVLA